MPVGISLLQCALATWRSNVLLLFVYKLLYVVISFVHSMIDSRKKKHRALLA
jgi:hypothetical protein